VTEHASVVEIAEAVRVGMRRAVEVLDDCLTTIERSNPELNAFVHLDADGARRAAEAVDSAVAAGRDPGPLAGVPFGVKDLEDCAGMPTSHGSLLYKGRRPASSDSVPVARMRAAGAIPVGKTAAPEFGAAALTDTKAWGTTRNPWDLSRTPGGSSGGSAAAVASGMVPIATASDGGGSIRIPAAFSGLLGFKPSFGRIPHPYNQPSATTVFGCLATSVADAARHLDVVAGPSDLDRTSLPREDVRYEEVIEVTETAGLRALWSPDLGFAAVDSEVSAIAESAAGDLIRGAGLVLVSEQVELSDPVRLWASSGVLDLFMDVEPGMWPERADEMMPYVSIPLRRASEATPDRIAGIWKRRLQLDAELADLFSRIDVLLTPTTAVPAFGAEWPMPSEVAGTGARPSMAVPFTMLANLGWHPAASVPAGITAAGLPVGLQIQSRRHADTTVLRLARVFERIRPWPRLATGYERI
jgi:aspartyl-tRNA(Asn)/glutamyl-tRNA(Gln) amidotransferase subunit A